MFFVVVPGRPLKFCRPFPSASNHQLPLYRTVDTYVGEYAYSTYVASLCVLGAFATGWLDGRTAAAARSAPAPCHIFVGTRVRKFRYIQYSTVPGVCNRLCSTRHTRMRFPCDTVHRANHTVPNDSEYLRFNFPTGTTVTTLLYVLLETRVDEFLCTTRSA